jgi:hypothetical protein
VNELIPRAVYLLCWATSVACAWLLIRAYLRGRTPLLLWSSVAFTFFSINNLLLVVDLVLFDVADLWVLRQVAAAAGLGTLLYGFVWARP